MSEHLPKKLSPFAKSEESDRDNDYKLVCPSHPLTPLPALFSHPFWPPTRGRMAGRGEGECQYFGQTATPHSMVLQLLSSSNFDSSNVVVVRHCYQLFNGLHLRQRRHCWAGHWTLQCHKREKTDTERKRRRRRRNGF